MPTEDVELHAGYPVAILDTNLFNNSHKQKNSTSFNKKVTQKKIPFFCGNKKENVQKYDTHTKFNVHLFSRT